MSIEKHSRPGWYYVKHYPNGRKGKPERLPVEGYEAAQKLDDNLKVSKTITPAVTLPRMEAVIDEYLAWCKTKWSPVTCEAKERRLNKYVLPFFGKYRVKDLQQGLLDQYLKGMEKWMYATDHAHLFAMVSWMIKRNYAEKLTWHPERVTGNHAVKPVPHPADLIAAIDSMTKEKHRVLFSLMLFSGLRWNEARNLKWKDIDLKSGSILVKEIVDGPQCIVYIPESLHGWFAKNAKTSGYIFESDRCRGRPVKNLWYVLEQAGKVCGVHLSTHTFRHASATYLYEQTRDIYQVQAHLRHTKVTTSQIYARMSVSVKQSAMGSILNYVDKNK